MKQRKRIFVMTALFVLVWVMCAGCGNASKDKIVFSGTESEMPDAETSEAEGGGITESVEADGGKAEAADGSEVQSDAQTGGQGTEVPDEEDNVQTTGTVFVHVCGAVNVPGVYELAKNARVYEAVAAAGGCTADASADSLNLALSVSDGMRIYVPDASEAAEMSGEWVSAEASETVSGGNSESVSGGASGALVNLNTASKEELMTLPGIGEAKAESIISYREQNGAFQRIEDIMQVNGIKNSIFDRIKDKIAV